jgi:hypothetical protein
MQKQSVISECFKEFYFFFKIKYIFVNFFADDEDDDVVEEAIQDRDDRLGNILNQGDEEGYAMNEEYY